MNPDEYHEINDRILDYHAAVTETRRQLVALAVQTKDLRKDLRDHERARDRYLDGLGQPAPLFDRPKPAEPTHSGRPSDLNADLADACAEANAAKGRRDCDTCLGSGRTYDHEGTEFGCPVCDGSGWVVVESTLATSGEVARDAAAALISMGWTETESTTAVDRALESADKPYTDYLDLVQEVVLAAESEADEEEQATEPTEPPKILDVSNLPPPRSQRKLTHYQVLHRRGDVVVQLGTIAAEYDGAALTDARKFWPNVPRGEMEIRQFSGKPPKADRKPRKPKVKPEPESNEAATYLVFKGSARKPLYAIRSHTMLAAIRLAKARSAGQYSPRVALDEQDKTTSLGLEALYAPPVEQQEAS